MRLPFWIIILSMQTFAQVPFEVHRAALSNGSQSSETTFLKPFKDGVLFARAIAGNGDQLFFSQGSPASTVSLTPGVPGSSLNVSDILITETHAYLFINSRGDRSILRTDGTLEGTASFVLDGLLDGPFSGTLLSPEELLFAHEDGMTLYHFENQSQTLIDHQNADFTDLQFFMIDDALFAHSASHHFSTHVRLHQVHTASNSTEQLFSSSSYGRFGRTWQNRWVATADRALSVFDGATFEDISFVGVDEITSDTGIFFPHQFAETLFFVARFDDHYKVFTTDLTTEGTTLAFQFTGNNLTVDQLASYSKTHTVESTNFTGYVSPTNVFLHNGTQQVFNATDFTNIQAHSVTENGVYVLDRADGNFELSYVSFPDGQVAFVKSLSDIDLVDDSLEDQFMGLGHSLTYFRDLGSNIEVMVRFDGTNPEGETILEFADSIGVNFGVFHQRSKEQGLFFRLGETHHSNGFSEGSAPLNLSQSSVSGVTRFKDRVVSLGTTQLFLDSSQSPWIDSVNYNALDLNASPEHLLYFIPEGPERSGLYKQSTFNQPELLATVPHSRTHVTSLGTYQGQEIIEIRDEGLYAWDAQTFTLTPLHLETLYDEVQPTQLGNLVAFQPERESSNEVAVLKILDLDTQGITEIPLAGEPYNTNLGNLVAFHDKFYFWFSPTGSAADVALYSSDGTIAGTGQVETGLGERLWYSRGIFSTNQYLFFFSRNSEAPQSEYAKLHTLDTHQNVQTVHTFHGYSFNPYNPNFEAVVFEDQLFFTHYQRETGVELWSSDGTEVGTQLFHESVDGSLGGGIEDLELEQGTLYWNVIMPFSREQRVMGYRSTPFAGFTTPAEVCSSDSQQTVQAMFNLDGATYEWQITGGSIVGAADARTSTFEVTNAAATLTLTVGFNGQSASFSKELSLIEAPAQQPTIDGPSEVCSNSVTRYEVVNANPESSYVWDITNGTILRSSVLHGQIEIVWGSGPGEVSVVEQTDCGSGPAATLQVTAADNPGVVYAGPDQTLCGELSTQLSATVPLTGQGTWQILSGSGGSVSDTNNPTAMFTGLEGESYTLQWAVSATQCANQADTLQITFLPAPIAAEAGSDLEVCGEAITLNGNAVDHVPGRWRVVSGAGGQFSDPEDPTAIFYGTEGRTYELAWRLDYGTCGINEDRIFVQFNRTPLASANDDLCADINGLYITGYAVYGEGMWQVISGPDTGADQFDDIGAATTYFTPLGGVGTYVLQWVVSNTACSSSVDEVVVEVSASDSLTLLLQRAGGVDGEVPRVERVFGRVGDRIIFSTISANADAVSLLWAYDTQTLQAISLGVVPKLRFSSDVVAADHQLLLKEQFFGVTSGYVATDGTAVGTKIGVYQDLNNIKGLLRWQNQDYVHIGNALFEGGFVGDMPVPFLPEGVPFKEFFIADDHLIALTYSQSAGAGYAAYVVDAGQNTTSVRIPETYSQIRSLGYYHAGLQVAPMVSNNDQLLSVNFDTQSVAPLTYLEQPITVLDGLEFNGQCYILGSHPTLGHAIFKTNGFANTLQVITSVGGQTSKLFSNGQMLFWSTPNEGFFASNGTQNHVVQLSEQRIQFYVVSEHAVWYIPTAASGRQLWVTDGTVVGTQLVYEVNEGETWSLEAVLTATDHVAAVETTNNRRLLFDRESKALVPHLNQHVHPQLFRGRNDNQSIMAQETAIHMVDAVAGPRIGLMNRETQAIQWHNMPVAIETFIPFEDRFVAMDAEEQLHVYTGNSGAPFLTLDATDKHWGIFGSEIALLDYTADMLHIHRWVDQAFVEYQVPAERLITKVDDNTGLYYLVGHVVHVWDPTTGEGLPLLDISSYPAISTRYYEPSRLRIVGDYLFIPENHDLYTIQLSTGTLFDPFETNDSIPANYVFNASRLLLSPEKISFIAYGWHLFQFDQVSKTFEQSAFPVNQGKLTEHQGETFMLSSSSGPLNLMKLLEDGDVEIVYANDTLTALDVNRLVSFKGSLLFSARSGELGEEWWISDGTQAGTRPLRDIVSGLLGSRPLWVGQSDDDLFFEAEVAGQRHLWAFDGFCVRPLMANNVASQAVFGYLGEGQGSHLFSGFNAAGDLDIFSYSKTQPRLYSQGLQDVVLAQADHNRDGQLSDQEAASITVLHLEGQGLSNLAGIERLINLRELYAADNALRDLTPLLAHPSLGRVAGSIIDVSQNELGTYCGQIAQLEQRAADHQTQFFWQAQKETVLPAQPTAWPRHSVLDLVRGVRVSNGGDVCAQ